MTERANLTDTLREIRHAGELAGSDHYPYPMSNECSECGIEECPTSQLARQVKTEAEAALGLVSVITQTAQAILDTTAMAAASFPNSTEASAHRFAQVIIDACQAASREGV